MNDSADMPTEPTPETAAETSSAQRSLFSAEQRTAAEALVKNGVIGSMAVGLVPVPVVGIVGLVASNVNMLQGMSKIYGVPFMHEAARSVVISLVGGLIPVSLGVGFSEILKLIPGFGSIAGAAGTSILAGSITYGVGHAMIAHFESGGTFLAPDLDRLRGAFSTEFQKGRKVAEDLAKSMRKGGKPAAEG